MVIESLLVQAQTQPDDIAIIDDGGQFTYRQLAGLSLGLSLLLHDKTASKTVGILLPTGGGFVTAFFGILLAGKSVVPINFLLGDKELLHVIRDSGIDLIISADPLAKRVAGLLASNHDLAVTVLDLPAAISGIMAVALTAAGPAQTPPLPKHAPSDLAAIVYTSGTSGLPKGVPLTFQNLQSSVDGSIAAAAFEHKHRFLGVLPLFHVFGLTAMMLAPIQLGATIVYMARFSPVGMLKAIREHEISVTGAVPSMLAALLRLKDAGPADFASMYLLLSGGEPLPSTLREAFLARFGVTLMEAYGMTETSLTIAVNTPTQHKPGSVGRPIGSVDVRLMDDAGQPIAGTSGEGEIEVRGSNVSAGYHHLALETAAAFTPDGYFRTGDIGRFDADGFLFITGRKKDLIIVSGEKVAPREVEEVLAQHPAVAEAAVVGKPDESRGEVVVAYVIAKEGQSVDADGLRDFCRKQGLAQWKVPREIKIVAEFPRSPTGKVLKRELAGREA